MPFSTTLPPYLNDSNCYASTLVSKVFGHEQDNEDLPDDSQNVEDTSEIEQLDTKLDREHQKFLILSRNLYQEDNSSPVPQYQIFNKQIFNPYPGRLQMSPFSPQFEDERPSKSPVYETEGLLSYKDQKMEREAEEQDERIFIPAQDAEDVFAPKPIYPWMVDSRHNTKNRQPSVYEGEKDQFQQFMAVGLPC